MLICGQKNSVEKKAANLRKQAVTTKCRGEFLFGAKSRGFEKAVDFRAQKITSGIRTHLSAGEPRGRWSPSLRDKVLIKREQCQMHLNIAEREGLRRSQRGDGGVFEKSYFQL